MTSLIKQGDAQKANLTGVRRIEVDLEFEQSTGGKLKGFMNRVNPVDPDLFVVAYCGRRGVNYANPKDAGHGSLYGGAVVHRGDARGSGVETAYVDLSAITRENSDIDGFGFFAVCKQGFERVPGATARIYDASGPERAWIGNVRFEFGPNHKTAVLGMLFSDGLGWQWVSRPRFGFDPDWQSLASLGAQEFPSTR